MHWCVYWCVGASTLVPRTPPKEHRLRPRGPCRPPFMRSIHLCPCPTSFEFVALAGDMSSNCTRSHWDYRLEREQAACTRGTTIVSTGYQGTTRVCYVCRSTKTQTSERSDEVSSYLMVAGHYISMYIEVTEDHLYNTQNSERSDEVSPHLMVAGVKGMYI